VEFCPGLRFVLDCVFSSTAFCLFEDHLLRFAKDKLCQNQNCISFCLRLRFASKDCVLPQKYYVLILRFAIEDLAFCSRRILRFDQEESCVLSKKTAICSRSFIAFCLNPVDTRPNGEALRKCILSGPYKPSTVLVHAFEATENSPAVAEHTALETPANMSPENKAHFLTEKEAIHLILTGIRDDIYSTVDACQTAQGMWEAIERLQQGQRSISLTTSASMVKQYQNEVNELHAKKLARNANPLALVATAQARQHPFYQSLRSYRSQAPSPKPSIPSRSHTSTRHKDKEIAKPITPPSETVSKEDSNPKQAQRDKDMQKNLALIAKYFKKIYKPTNNNLRTSSNSKNKNVDTTPWYKNEDHSGQFRTQRTVNIAGTREKECRKPKRIKDSVYHKEKMLLCKQAEQGVPLQAEQYDWLADTNEEVDEQELKAHYSYMAKIQEVPNADSGTDYEPVEQVQNDTGYNVFANALQHSEQSESNDQNDVESDDERVALVNLIANLKLDVNENKKIQKQLKKANTTLANRAIFTPNGIARDVFVPVGKFTFLADFVIVDYESDPRVPLIFGRPFLRTARALINVHGEEMILRDGDKRLTLNMKHDTASYSNHPYRESVNLINIFNLSKIASPEVIHEFHDSKGCSFLSEELPDIDSFNDIHPHFDDDPLSGSTTYSANSLLEEFADELALISYPPDYDDYRTCDIEDDVLFSPDSEDKVFNPG
nr:reverse transcriptase domain-containing protein [Tanacetum cinerariifolium]